MRSSIKFASAALLCTLCLSASADDDYAITPYRPSVSNSAQLPLPGQLELELGGLHGRSGDARRDSLPYLFKLAFNNQWGVLLGGEAAVSARDESGNRVRGVGDTGVVLKRAFLVDDKTAYGLEFGLKLPTAKDSIGSGKTDYTLNGIVSKDLGAAVHVDGNLNLTRIGAIDAGTARMQAGWSAAFSLPFADRWSGIAELSGTHRGGTDNTGQVLAALTYSPSKQLTFDAGLTRSLNSAQEWSLFAGVVLPIAKLW